MRSRLAKANAALQRRYRDIARRMVPGAEGVAQLGECYYWYGRSKNGIGRRLIRPADIALPEYVRRCVLARDRVAACFGFRPETFALPALY